MILCGTGHRPNKLGGYNKWDMIKVVDLAEKHLLKLKPEKVITGMAQGWDQALAVAALSLDDPIHVIAAVPFEGQERAWPIKARHLHRDILLYCDEVVIVSDGEYESWMMQKRNQWMVDRSDVVLALWDGSSGGTKKCVDYAEKRDKIIINLWNEWSLS